MRYSNRSRDHPQPFPEVLANIADFDDPNIDIENAVVGVLGEQLHVVVCAGHSTALTEDDSPYPEVRSAVSNTDDQSIPTSTLRAWVLGKLFGRRIIPC